MKKEAITGQFQDLSTFRLPPGLRGRPAWFVQVWEITQALLFHSSPQALYGWRRFLLRLFGARIGKCAMLRPSVTVTYPWKLSIGDWSWVGDHVTLYTVGEITIGESAVVSQHSYLCTSTHDYARTTFDTLVAPIRIESEAWLASNVFVGPGITVGSGAVVGACSVVLKDVPAGMICAGNPLRVLRHRPTNVP
ncbi:MAG: WcaF family extracellular polysaccharide biosynthesis acetyltransferase [Terracidiphilus sp.]